MDASEYQQLVAALRAELAALLTADNSPARQIPELDETISRCDNLQRQVQHLNDIRQKLLRASARSLKEVGPRVNNINEKRAFFLADRVSLVDQACNTFKAHLPDPVRLTRLPRRRQAVVFTSAPIPRS